MGVRLSKGTKGVASLSNQRRFFFEKERGWSQGGKGGEGEEKRVIFTEASIEWKKVKNFIRGGR